MDTILVVCGAGASSTFLASRMRSLAKDRGILTVTARPVSTAGLADGLPTASVLLVGPHLEREFAILETDAAEYAVPAALLPSTAFGPAGAAAALDLALSLLAQPAAGSATN